MENKSYQSAYKKPFLDYFNPVTKRKEDGFNRPISLDYLYQSIRQSLADMLQTRVRAVDAVRHEKAVKSSVIHYGMPDFTDIKFGSKSGEIQLCKQIKEIITLYEPRLKNIEVNVLDKKSDYGVLRLRIMAQLNMNDLNQTVVYDSNYNASNSRFLMAG